MPSISAVNVSRLISKYFSERAKLRPAAKPIRAMSSGLARVGGSTKLGGRTPAGIGGRVAMVERLPNIASLNLQICG